MDKEQHFDEKVLKQFEERISASEGVEIAWLLSETKRLFSLKRSQEDKKSYRLKAGVWKKLRAEVVVVTHHLRFKNIKQGRIRFPLDNEPPDCWLWLDGAEKAQGLEVTAALARSQIVEAKKMNEEGHVRLQTPLADDSSNIEFAQYSKNSESPGCYETQPVVDVMMKGIQICIRKKENKISKNHDLLIDAHLKLLAEGRWSEMIKALQASGKDAKPRQIHVISYGGEETIWGFQIK